MNILEISVAYLLQFDKVTPLTKAMLESSPLAQYAAEHWIDHANFEGIDPAPLKLILQLFTPESAASQIGFGFTILMPGGICARTS